MLKFVLASRSKPEHTKERYYFEWGIIHVSLMLLTPTVMSTFRRYAQHFVPDGLDGGRLLFPFSDDGVGEHGRPLAGDLGGPRPPR